MTKLALAGVAALALATGVYFTTAHSETAPTAQDAGPAEGSALVAVTLPDSLSAQARAGKQAFDAVCAACHGQNAAGKQGFGPPLVHPIYEPSHHGDGAFFVAAERGVRAHHWRFGNMPPQKGLTRADVTGIVAYVRELQRANGID